MIGFKLSITTKFTIGGILFGLLFPIGAVIADCLVQQQDISWSGAYYVHQHNVIHYIVDTAPFVLGLFGYLLGRMTEKMHFSNKKLSETNKALDLYTYKITHDLRGPALNIRSLIDILSATDSPDTLQTSVMEQMRMASDKWLKTFQDFIDLLKEKNAGEKLKMNCDIKSVITQLMEENHDLITKHKVNVIVQLEDAPLVVAAHDDLISIFRNLVTNAIKYAHPDRVLELDISYISYFDSIAILIADNGIGIDLAIYGDKLFSLFERGEQTAGVFGSGIGLYLVQEQVKRNSGKITVQSTLGEGTVFQVSFPIIKNASL